MGPDKCPQRNRADANQCRGCKKSYYKVFGRNVDASKTLPAKPEHDNLRKELQKQEKRSRELEAQIKAYEEGSPVQQGQPEESAKEATEENHKENLEKAKKQLKDLNDFSESQKAIFPDFEEKLAEAKNQVDIATKAKFKGQPMDAQLRGAKTRMEHVKQALDNKKAAQAKLVTAFEQAKQKAEEGEKAVAELSAKLEVQTREYAELQKQNAQQLVGQSNEILAPAVPSNFKDALQALFKAVPGDQAKDIFEQTGIGQENFGNFFENLFKKTGTEITEPTAFGKSADPPENQSTPNLETIKDDVVMDWEDLLNGENFDLTDEVTFKQEVDTLVQAGFKPPDTDEERQTTKTRIAEWAKKRKQEDIARREEDRKSTAAYKVLKAGKKSKSSASK